MWGRIRFSPLLLEYQVQMDLVPDLGGYFGVEVFMYQQLLLSLGGEGA
jgi:hypothetical protein